MNLFLAIVQPTMTCKLEWYIYASNKTDAKKKAKELVKSYGLSEKLNIELLKMNDTVEIEKEKVTEVE